MKLTGSLPSHDLRFYIPGGCRTSSINKMPFCDALPSIEIRCLFSIRVNYFHLRTGPCCIIIPTQSNIGYVYKYVYTDIVYIYILNIIYIYLLCIHVINIPYLHMY